VSVSRASHSRHRESVEKREMLVTNRMLQNNVRNMFRSSLMKRRVFSGEAASSMSDEKWSETFAEWAANVKILDHETSANQLRDMVKTRLLKFTDLRDDPEKFFEAHKLLAGHATRLGPGFWIRFTVQYNLFAGTILALASEEQLSILDKMHDDGHLGAFGLTERFAGVNSGLVVNTTAEWNEEKGVFVLNSKDDGAFKNWISQGITCDKLVVMANLFVNGKSVGPHAFVTDFRRDGKVVDGITFGDMGIKTVGNDLDNAWLKFENVEMPRDALLNRYADIDEKTGEYGTKVKGIRPFDMIGQRLFTGRVAVAQAALTFRDKLFEQTKHYSDNKKCWAPKGEQPVLSDIPQLKALYKETEQEAGRIQHFVDSCQADLCETLRQDKMPSLELVEAIAVAKVAAVEMSIDHCFRLKQEVGSYALMGGTGFEQMDFLQCCKFAEGDSRILMQKMARDSFRMYQKDKPLPDRVSTAAETLDKSLKSTDLSNPAKAWDECWTDVYDLAKACITDTLEKRT